MPRLRVATRASPLALAQAQLAVEALRAAGAAEGAELVHVRTEGDARPEPLAAIAGRGVFVKDVDERLLAGEADLAVHSCKDIPTDYDPGLAIAALLPRGPAHDVLVGPATLDGLPQRARVGTSSPRRAAQLRRARPDVAIVPLRGNVATRLGRVGTDCDATVLAAAGLARLGLQPQGHALPLDAFPTAPGQGAIAVVARAGSPASALAARIDDAATRAAVAAERAVLRRLGTGCAAPLGCHAAWEGPRLRLVAELLALDGARAARAERFLDPARALEEADLVGAELAKEGRDLVPR